MSNKELAKDVIINSILNYLIDPPYKLVDWLSHHSNLDQPCGVAFLLLKMIMEYKHSGVGIRIDL
jgi:hypothetical protein